VEYCGHLAGRVATAHQQAVQPPPEVEILVVEGRRMCDEGHVRGGIARLRRALMLLLREAENEK
jgi:hypothetical protein